MVYLFDTAFRLTIEPALKYKYANDNGANSYKSTLFVMCEKC
jgi:hypothetical protein